VAKLAGVFASNINAPNNPLHHHYILVVVPYYFFVTIFRYFKDFIKIIYKKVII